ncbi:dipicolinate synthase subunit B [Oscillospiraceae bacterium PP1C4]
MEKMKLGFGMTGSFCTWEKVLPVMAQLAEIYEITPILSPISYTSDNRFGNAANWIEQIEDICGRKVLHKIEQVEPIGPKNLLDVMAIVPCTGNTIGKLANGITDTAILMAAKANLRNGKPLVIAISTNDALTGSARNIGTLMNAKNVYFVPMSQDDPFHKPASMVAHFNQVGATIEAALQGRQQQPIFC